jgi:3-oxoadipate enol-lactonase
MWGPQVDALADRFRLVRYDTRGHGGTPLTGEPDVADLAGDIADLLDHLGIERARLVGTSLGGATVLAFAARHPGRADRLAVICSAARIATPEYWADRAEAVHADGMALLAGAAMERWFTDRFRAEHPDTVRAIRERLAACDPSGYAALCRTLGRLDLRGALASITAPTLVLYATEDPVTTEADARTLREGIPDCTTAAVPGARHLATTERASLVNRLLTAFLAK